MTRLTLFRPIRTQPTFIVVLLIGALLTLWPCAQKAHACPVTDPTYEFYSFAVGKAGTKDFYEVYVGVDKNSGVLSTMTNHDLQLRAGGDKIKMIITADGNVGIGCDGPAYPLQVIGEVRAEGFIGWEFKNASSRELKRDIAKLSTEEAMEALQD